MNAFIPKPHTPYEDESSRTPTRARKEEARRRVPEDAQRAFRGMPVTEAVWEAYLAKMDESGPILEEAAAGAPVRTLVKEHRETLLAVARPARASRPHRRGVFDLASRQASPWGFISKS